MTLPGWMIGNIMLISANGLKLNLGKLKIQKKNKQKMLDGSEKSMMPILLENQGSIVRYDKTVLARQEFSAGTGIADVVMFSINDKILSKRLKKQQAALTDYRLLSAYLAIERNSGMTVDELVTTLSFSRRSIRDDILPALTESSLVELNDHKLYILDANVNQSPVTKCVAIEAKVKDWRGGIRQACRYKEFADETYLAIYKKHSSAALKNIELFKSLDVGLLIVDDGCVELVFRPSANRFKLVNRLLASERLISTLDNLNKPFVPREPFASRGL